MENRYRIYISGKNFQKEIEVSPEDKIIRFGTETACDVRIRKETVLEPFVLSFFRNDQGGWNIGCTDNLYISVDEVRKLLKAPMQHGTQFVVCYQNASIQLLHVLFLVDFEYENKKYDRRFDISGLKTFSIGGEKDNQIILNGPYTVREKIVCTESQQGLELRIYSSVYGVYHNGNIVNEKVLIKNNDFFSVANYSFYYNENFLYTQKDSNITTQGIRQIDATVRDNYPKFNRNPRIKTVLDDKEIEILDPSAKPSKPKNNLLRRLLPSFIMLATSGVMCLVGGMFIIISLVSAVGGILTAILGVKDEKKDYIKSTRERVEKYNAYIANKREEIEKARQNELDELKKSYISSKEEIGMMKQFSSELFDRCKQDEDFLDVCLGLGSVIAKKKVKYKKQERLETEDELQKYPEKLCQEYKYISDAPIVCNFRDAGAIGIIGSENGRFSILKNIIMDICARQFFSDVQMYFVAEKQHADIAADFRMLPHVQNNVLGIHNIVCDEISRAVIFEYLYKEMSVREANKTKYPHIVVFLYDEFGFKSHPVSKFVENAKELGVTFVFFGSKKSEIGLGCSYLILQQETGKAKLIYTDDSKKEIEFRYEEISNRDIESMVELLAPVYTEEISLEQSLIKNISLYEMLNIIAADDLDLQTRWNSSRAWESMAAPIGIAKNGIVYLDLHDKAHGPHGLVAGTTGAGKSEILQTYILAMATLYHPYEVGFVLIDFKGGGMAKQFEQLPHLMGTITNIDGKEINRSLKSIKAELDKRQQLFKKADVNHIDKYIVKYRKGEVEIPLPHLIIIVDEFAELRANQPEFMKELISAARIGRSLGVHLILATQKPSGQVDEQIWSNSRFKLCLKVQSPQDSNEVLKSPLAAEIKEPGRAYFQVGNNEIFELFQSAYSGAPEQESEDNVHEFTLYEITKSGKRVPVYVQKKKKSDEEVKTQLTAIVEYIESFCEEQNLSKLPNICLPALEKSIAFPELTRHEQEKGHIIANIGIYDDPDNQVQDEYSIDLSKTNVMIIGSTQSGKTNLLQTIIRSVAEKYTPEQAIFYIIDFASMYLKNFENLCHVGGVVTASEDEKLKNLFKMLNEEMQIRKEKFLSKGAGSYLAYCEMGYSDIPFIIITVDNMTVLHELYLTEYDPFLIICRDGLSVGISIILSNSQTNGIGYKYMANFDNKIMLNCNDPSEYSTIFGYSKFRPADIVGRALVTVQKEIYEAQVYEAFEGEREIEKIKNIKTYISKNNGINNGLCAKKIPYVPEILTDSMLRDMYGVMADNNSFCLGLDYEGVNPHLIKWMNYPILGISGGEAKEQYIKKLEKTFLECQYELYIIDDYTGLFENVSDKEAVQLYTRNMDDVEEILINLQNELEKRFSIREIYGVKEIDKMKPIIMIIHNMNIVEYINNNKSAANLYKNIFDRYKGLKCCVIFTNMANEKIPAFNIPEVWKPFSRGAQYICFEESINDIKLFDISLSDKKKYAKKLTGDECFLLDDKILRKIKTVH